MKVENNVNYTSFRGIKSILHLGEFAKYDVSGAKNLAITAFQKSKPIQKYCSTNNVDVIMVSNPLGYYKSFAKLIIKKFPEKENMNLIQKIQYFFRRKPQEIISINAEGDSFAKAHLALAKRITAIKSKEELLDYKK